jgi:hypothetical protein
MLRKTAVGFVCLVGVSLLGLLGTGVSVAADNKVPATFINATDGDFELFWLDSGKNKEVSYGVVPQGKKKTVETYNGSVWIIRGAKGEQLRRYTVEAPEGGEVFFRPAGPQAELPGKP